MDTMKKDHMRKWTVTLVFLIVFALFTAAVKLVDVEKAGPLESEIGFAKLNTAVSDRIGYHPALFEAAQVLGYLAILLCIFFGAVGFFQMIGRRSIVKVDAEILSLGIFYLSVIFFYVLFEFLKVNYRPVLIDGELEASFPSSHTMLGLSVFGTAIPVVGHYFGKRPILKRILGAILAFLAVSTVLTRFLSGTHWLTDIVGSLLLTAALTEFFTAISAIIKRAQYKAFTEKQQ